MNFVFEHIQRDGQKIIPFRVRPILRVNCVCLDPRNNPSKDICLEDYESPFILP